MVASQDPSHLSFSWSGWQRLCELSKAIPASTFWSTLTAQWEIESQVEKITISIQGVHTGVRDCPSTHLTYNGWNSRPRAEHSRNNPAAPSPYSTQIGPRSVTSKGKMNKESSLQSKQQVNVASQLELLQTLPSPSSALPSHVRQGSNGRVHRPAALLPGWSHTPSQLFYKPLCL